MYMLHMQARPACLHSCVCVPSNWRRNGAAPPFS